LVYIVNSVPNIEVRPVFVKNSQFWMLDITDRMTNIDAQLSIFYIGYRIAPILVYRNKLKCKFGPTLISE
jgi:hypothetical protein